MEAYFGDVEVKNLYLKTAKQHQAVDITQDELREIHYCLVRLSGVPEWLILVEKLILDNIMYTDTWYSWSYEFLNAINVGADLNLLKFDVASFILKEALKTFNNEKAPDIARCIKSVITLIDAHETDLQAYSDTGILAWDPFVSVRPIDLAMNAASLITITLAKPPRDEFRELPIENLAVAMHWGVEYGYSPKHREQQYTKIADKLLDLIKGCE